MSLEDIITLESQDGTAFKVTVKVANMSMTIRNMIEDTGIDAHIPLPNVTSKTLAKVIEFCVHHSENPMPVAKDDEKRTDDLSSWDQDFCKALDQASLFEILLAANYLDIKLLLDVTCKTVANMIKGKTPDEICKTFNIANDFTPEEMEQVRLENQWCEETNA